METGIDCQDCGKCCYLPFIFSLEQEVKRIAEAKGLEPEKFSWPNVLAGDIYLMKLKENGDCFFLKREQDRFYCAIYDLRPIPCRKFPETKEESNICPTQ